jgi:cytochrome b561
MSISTGRYTKTAVILHWLIAIFIIAMFGLGWFMADLPKDAPKQTVFDLFDLGMFNWTMSEEVSPRNFYFNLHKSIGVTIFALIILRILWRITHKPPAMLTSYKAWERKLATATHHLLYIFMIILPLSGVLMTLNGKYGLKWFGLDFLSGTDNKPMREFYQSAHEIIGLIILAILALHVIGALKHKFIDKDDTLKRMSLK